MSRTVTVMLHTFVWEDLETAIAYAKKPFCDYLSQHVSFEILAEGKEFPHIAPNDKIALIELAFQRYIDNGSLIGDLPHCQKMVNRLAEIGVDEIACFIDFGIDNNLVIKNLRYLSQLKNAGVQFSKSINYELSQLLRDRMPSYMVPSYYINYDSLPLSTNGKVDRVKLKKININAITDLPVSNKICPPSTVLEKKLTKVWATILPVSEISIHDNFFHLGGCSILVIKLLAKLEREFKLSFSVREIYMNATLSKLADLIKNKMQSEQKIEKSTLGHI